MSNFMPNNNMFNNNGFNNTQNTNPFGTSIGQIEPKQILQNSQMQNMSQEQMQMHLFMQTDVAKDLDNRAKAIQTETVNAFQMFVANGCGMGK